ncbi:MAG TPA: NIL domain-containing protein, partial [Paenalcaligenes sp.]|nr:NIL domain-containing protein [Paenalcaligenes sp.]
HQMEVIKQVCERVAVLDAGQVIEQGEVIDVFMRPQHEITRSMIGDLVAQSLPAGVRERIIHKLEAGNHFLYRLAFVDTDVDQPLLSTVIREFQLDFNILHGYIDEIQGQAFGSLAVMVGGAQTSIQAAVQYLRGRGVVIEELPYV